MILFALQSMIIVQARLNSFLSNIISRVVFLTMLMESGVWHLQRQLKKVKTILSLCMTRELSTILCLACTFNATGNSLISKSATSIQVTSMELYPTWTGLTFIISNIGVFKLNISSLEVMIILIITQLTTLLKLEYLKSVYMMLCIKLLLQISWLKVILLHVIRLLAMVLSKIAAFMDPSYLIYHSSFMQANLIHLFILFLLTNLCIRKSMVLTIVSLISSIQVLIPTELLVKHSSMSSTQFTIKSIIRLV